MKLHLYVFADSVSIIGVEAYSIEKARELIGEPVGLGRNLIYCKACSFNGGPSQIIFECEVTDGGSDTLQVKRSQSLVGAGGVDHPRLPL